MQRHRRRGQLEARNKRDSPRGEGLPNLACRVYWDLRRSQVKSSTSPRHHGRPPTKRKSFHLNQLHQYFLWNTQVHLEVISVLSLIQSCGG